MKKLFAITGFCLISTFIQADCIDFANAVAKVYYWDTSTVGGFTNWQNFYLACVENFE